MPEQTADANAIVGRWRSPPQGWGEGEWGPTQIVLEFKPSGEVRLTLTVSDDSPGGGGTHSAEGPYRVTDRTLATELLSRGEPIDIAFKDGHLMLTLPQEAPDRVAEVYEFAKEDGIQDNVASRENEQSGIGERAGIGERGASAPW